MTRWLEFKLWLAGVLLTNTKYEIVVGDKIDSAREGIWALSQYVQRSGGLCDPRRIRAKKKIERTLSTVDIALAACYLTN